MKKFVETSDLTRRKLTKLVCALSNRTMAVFLSDEELESFSNTRGYSVLVVGDDDLARKLVHVLGVGRGSLVVASDGSEGLRFLTSPSHDRFSLTEAMPNSKFAASPRSSNSKFAEELT